MPSPRSPRPAAFAVVQTVGRPDLESATPRHQRSEGLVRGAPPKPARAPHAHAATRSAIRGKREKSATLTRVTVVTAQMADPGDADSLVGHVSSFGRYPTQRGARMSRGYAVAYRFGITPWE
jgi:hypothetical protein